MLRAVLLLLLTNVAVFAHGNTYIFVELIPHDDRIAIEVTMDVGDNPLVSDSDMVRQTIQMAVQIVEGEQLIPLAQFGTWRLESRQQFANGTPALSEDNQRHELVTGIWTGILPKREVIFHTPRRTPFDVILWSRQPTLIAGSPPWTLLINSERSPMITIPQPESVSFGTIVAVCSTIFGAGIGIIIGWLRQRRTTNTRRTR